MKILDTTEYSQLFILKSPKVFILVPFSSDDIVLFIVSAVVTLTQGRPMEEVLIIYWRGGNPLRSRNTPRGLLDLYVTSVIHPKPASSLLGVSSTAARSCDPRYYPYSHSAATEYYAKAPVLIRRDVVLLRL